ncbi:hypothetical protein EJ06DRAFT_504817 [Trichodelitschia bisporula]|uniref:Phox-like protein n=1 Tax=Trichodelitschia bisporula TaxID=703511 RepID=A0A6G1I6D1_9PEZI|nr:hypothetical protein EJ06DRAFT_504817 [Trichodelitschia bisporula]
MPYTLTIPTTSTAVDGSTSKPYTLYNIHIATPLRTTILAKRYSAFEHMHAAITAAVGSAPPTSLPSKGWFTRTVGNPALTEARRRGLEDYLRAIEYAEDPRWRESSAYREFLGLQSKSRASSVAGTEDEARPGMSAAQWLDLHSQLKSLIQDARLLLARRERAGDAAAQREAGTGAKKALVRAGTLVLRLDEGLRGLADGRGGVEKLGEGEVRRRRDLLGRAKMEREGLEGVLSAWSAVGREAAGASAGASGTYGGNGSTMPGAFPVGLATAQPAFSGRRVLGGPPAKETERTRERDNEGVLMLQKQIMHEQEEDVQDLSKVVRRMKDMGIAINEELVEQGGLMDILDSDIDRVGGKMDVAKRRIKKLG